MFARELLVTLPGLVALYAHFDILVNSAFIIQILNLICIIGIIAILVYRIKQSHSEEGLRCLAKDIKKIIIIYLVYAILLAVFEISSLVNTSVSDNDCTSLAEPLRHFCQMRLESIRRAIVEVSVGGVFDAVYAAFSYMSTMRELEMLR